MAKKILSKSFIILFLLAFIFVLFPLATTNFADAAIIEGVSGNRIVLTGICGYSPEHFFYDENGASTLVNAKVKNQGDKYYSIVSDWKNSSSGWSEFKLPNDMRPFVEKGLLYAQASANIETKYDTQIKLKISAGDLMEEVTGENGQIATPLLRLFDQDQNVRFTFEATSKNIWNNFVISSPAINFYTVIDSVSLDESDQVVSPGQIVKINATNDVLDVEGTNGNFMKFSKINHAINFDIVEGKEYVNVVGSNLFVSQNAKDGAKIKFRVFANKNSYSTEKVYSENYVTLTVDANNVVVKVNSDFSKPAIFEGEGIYTPGRKFVLTQTPLPDFEFLGWYVDGEFESDEDELIVTATQGQEIFAKYRKAISIESVQVPSRIYDGTTDIDQENVKIDFSGLEEGHEVTLNGATFAFADANAGQNKIVKPNFEELTLTGANSQIYKLKSASFPQIFGEIYKREAKILPQTTQKEYGYQDTAIAYTFQNCVEGDSIVGSLGREEGETIGKYSFTAGDLPNKNPNYNINIEDNGNYFEIVERTLSLENVMVEEKIYDGTTDAVIRAGLKNIFNDEDVSVQVSGKFVSPDAANSVEATITKIELVGKDKNNYKLEAYEQKIYGQIDPKPVTVEAEDVTARYGDEIKLEYLAFGLVGQDTFSGSLVVNDKNVGNHLIEVGTLANPNYVIETFKSAVCSIYKRKIQVKAKKEEKDFGDVDPSFGYIVTNLIAGDQLSGSLKREGGEDVGIYEINQCELENPNYEITFAGNVFEIKPREIFVVVSFEDKQYDGTNNVTYDVSFLNNIKNADFDLTLQAQLLDKNCGLVKVEIQEQKIECQDMKNYIFTFKIVKDEIEIAKRNVYVFVDDANKIYGENDQIFSYEVKDIVEGEALEIDIEREEGEDVGFYRYSLDEFYEIRNQNYNICLGEAFFEIVPRTIRVSIQNHIKIFGDKDQEIAYKIEDPLCFGQLKEEIVDGIVLRQEGESVGVYEFDLSQLSSSKNYVFENCEDSNFIIKKRPVVVKIHDDEKTYGEEDPIFQYTVENEVEGAKLSVQIDRDYGEDVGEYRLVCGTKNDDRYDIQYVEGSLTISPCKISVRADDKVKIYGDKDPLLSVTIISGFLKNNDRQQDILEGELERVAGESVDTYDIKIGTLSFGKNYSVSFESGKLTIIKRHITISAIDTTKIYGEVDPDLKFAISSDGLAFSDKVDGALERAPGEAVGEHEILQGSISVNNNYDMDFVGGKLKILKRTIEIIPTTLSKTFGDEDREITYKIDGSLVFGDKLSGNLYFEKTKTEREAVGRYKICSSLENDNYDIVFGEYYFTILPREIVIQADSFEIKYGQDDPELSYHVVSGQILPGDEISGDLHRVKGTSVGSYDIISSLTLGRNYKISFKKGTVTILPREITIRSENYSKFYGQKDPTFTYEIVEGNLLNNDKLYGVITRQSGEDVGVYALENGVYNGNYSITLEPAHLEITKKDVYLISSIYNKIYDGTTTARLRNPYISGAIDEIYLQYDKNNCADFVTPQVGTNIGVKLHDITVVGEKAENYNLVLPNLLYADITMQEIGDLDVKISAEDPVLYSTYRLSYSAEKIEEKVRLQNYRMVLKYNICFKQNEQQISPNSTYTIKITLPKEVFLKNNIVVYQKLDNGKIGRLSSQKTENGEIVITALSLGEFYIAVDDDSWIDQATIIAIAILGMSIIFAVVIIVSKRRKKKNKIIKGV